MTLFECATLECCSSSITNCVMTVTFSSYHAMTARVMKHAKCILLLSFTFWIEHVPSQLSHSHCFIVFNLRCLYDFVFACKKTLVLSLCHNLLVVVLVILKLHCLLLASKQSRMFSPGNCSFSKESVYRILNGMSLLNKSKDNPLVPSHPE